MKTITEANKDQIIISSKWDSLRFHLRRGKGHLYRYIRNRFRWHYYPEWQKVTEYPEHVDLEMSSACNMKCPMCYTTTERFKKEIPKKMLNWDTLKCILDEIGGGKVFSIRLSLRGEPTLHKDYIKTLKYAKEVGIPEVSSLTNALKLNEQMMRDMIEAPLDWLTISVDGVGETYNKIRFPAKFEDLLVKLKRFQELKKEYGSDKPVIKVQSVWPAIKDDPKTYYDTFRPLVDQVASNQLVDYLDQDDPNSIQYKEGFKCPAIYQRLIIGADGTVLFCHNDAYNEHAIGNIETSTIKEMWHSPGMNAIREAYIRQTALEEYSACRRCYLPRKMEEVEVVNFKGGRVKVNQLVGRAQEVGR